MTTLFAIAVTLGLLLFLTIDPSTSSGQCLTSAHLASDCGLMAVFGRDAWAESAKPARAGWPLTFYEEGGFDYRRTFQSGMLAIDQIIGFVFARTIGWLFVRHLK